MTPEEEADYFTRRLNELSPDTVTTAASHLRSLSKEWPLEEFRELHQKYGNHEWFFHVYDKENEKIIQERKPGMPPPYLMHPHSTFGMGLRNALRDTPIVELELPSQNWDDYYIEVLEIALGFRKEKSTVDACA